MLNRRRNSAIHNVRVIPRTLIILHAASSLILLTCFIYRIMNATFVVDSNIELQSEYSVYFILSVFPSAMRSAFAGLKLVLVCIVYLEIFFENIFIFIFVSAGSSFFGLFAAEKKRFWRGENVFGNFISVFSSKCFLYWFGKNNL